MFISICTYTESVANPYHSRGMDMIEPKFIEETKKEVLFFTNMDSLKEHIKENTLRPFAKGTYNYYSAQELRPTITTEVVVNV